MRNPRVSLRAAAALVAVASAASFLAGFVLGADPPDPTAGYSGR